MRGWIVGQIVLLIGAMGVPGAARAQDIGSGAFTSQAQAERYLRQTPTGPQAKAAFLAIVEFQLARENPGFSRSDIAKGVNLKVAGTSTRADKSKPNNERKGGGGGDLY